MEDENEKNSSIKAGELSDDDLEITLKNGVYTIRNITTGKTVTFRS